MIIRYLDPQGTLVPNVYKQYPHGAIGIPRVFMRSMYGSVSEKIGSGDPGGKLGCTGFRRFKDLGFRELFMNRLSLKTIRKTRVYLPPRPPNVAVGAGWGTSGSTRNSNRSFLEACYLLVLSREDGNMLYRDCIGIMFPSSLLTTRRVRGEYLTGA